MNQTISRAACAACVLLLSALLGGCVPIPYRPAAKVAHETVEAPEAAAIVLAPKRTDNFLEGVRQQLQRAEPRIVLIDSVQYMYTVLPDGHGTVADFLTGRAGQPRAPDARNPDYLLSVGRYVQRQLHDTGDAEPFPFFPVLWVGYEKTQSRAYVSALLVDLSERHAAQALLVSSDYSEVIVALCYGFSTVATPTVSLRDALVQDVAHTLAAARPQGPIRVVVVAQDGGVAEQGPDPRQTAKSAATSPPSAAGL